MLVRDKQPATVSAAFNWLPQFQLQVQPSGRSVKVRPGRTTIGSSPRCDVRIQEPGLQPLHCLIIHNGEELTARRWAGEAALNGQPLNESVLSPGDFLQVGSVTLELVELAGNAPTPLPTESSQHAAGAAEDEPAAGVQHQSAGGLELPQDEMVARAEEYRPCDLRNPLEETVEELRQLLADASQREEAYLRALQDAEDWRQQLEQSKLREITLTEALAQQESELTSARQANAETVGRIDQHERQLAQYEQLLSASTATVQQLEQRLSEVLEASQALEQGRDGWQRERAELERQIAAFADQVQRLEEQLEGAPSDSRPPVCVEETSQVDTPSLTQEEIGEQATAVTEAGQDPGLGESAGEFQPGDADSDPFRSPVESEVPAGDYDWGRTPSAVEWAVPSPAEDTSVSSDQWESPAASHDSERAGTQRTESDVETSAADEMEVASQSAFRAPNSDSDQPSDNIQAAVAAESAAKAEPESFIARYSHMFADEAAADDAGQQQPGVGHAPRDNQAMDSPRPIAGVAAPAGDEDEESIEQYMARLLQRVRGEGRSANAAAVKVDRESQPTASGPLGYERSTPLNAAADLSAASLPVPGAAEAGENSICEGAVELPPQAARRKPSVPVPQTDLEALRALANESARRAISRHSLRKHRRNAMTKVIVSTLAGMTSLWLMLESPDWRDLQFLIACISMLVAAYWAGETFRTLLESFRVAACDDTEEEIKEISAELQSRLPIDLIGPRHTPKIG